MANFANRLASALADRYRVERELGAGGMATVYLAHDLRHDRAVAIKVLRPEVSSSLGAERFLREIRLAARLQHPHILPLFDSGEVDGQLFYVMPYVPGESLRQRLQREKMLPIADAHRIAREVADALAFAHAEGVVHRDIKPENILLSGGHAVVADFGIARAIDEAGGESLTGAGIALGTPAYMSPEQSSGAHDLDGRSDEYSLGCVLYEMLTGVAPFHGPTTESVIQQHLTAEAIPIESRRASVPVITSSIVRRAMAKNPADRFSSVSEMAEALARVETSSGETPMQPARGGRVLRYTVGAVVVLLAVAVVLTVRRSATTGSENAPAAADTASVAILRCATSAPASDADELLNEGITQDIISRLTQVEDLRVISGSSVMPLARAGLSTAQIADTLGVRYVFECNVTKVGNRVRIFGQLMDARTRAIKWAKPFEQPLAEQATMEDDIAQQVVAALVAQSGTLRPTGSASRTRVPEAAAALLEGNYLLHRRSPDAIRGAIAAYRRAISLDSGFAPAYAELGSAYGLSLTYNADLGRSPYEVYAQGLVVLTRAIELDSTLAEAYAARGYIATKAYGPSETIALDFQQALRYRPNSADVHGWYAHFLSREGRHDESIVEAEKAIALDPIAPGRRNGFSLDAISARRTDRALREAKQALVLEPGLGTARYLVAISSVLLGDGAQCRAAQPRAGVLALCLRALDSTAAAQAIVDSLGRVPPSGVGGQYSGVNDAVRAGDLATYFAWTGDAARAAQWLERAFQASPDAIDFRALSCALFDKVRNDSTFAAVHARLRQQVWERTSAVRATMTRQEAVGRESR